MLPSDWPRNAPDQPLKQQYHASDTLFMGIASNSRAKPRSIDKAAIAELIDATTWCNDFSWNQIETLAQFFEPLDVPKGYYVFREGANKAYMCLVATGSVVILKDHDGPSLKPLANIGRGRTFGEMSLLDGQPRSASAVARVDSKLLVLTSEKFSNLCARYPRLGLSLVLKIANQLSQKLRQTSGQVVAHPG